MLTFHLTEKSLRKNINEVRNRVHTYNLFLYFEKENKCPLYTWWSGSSKKVYKLTIKKGEDHLITLDSVVKVSKDVYFTHGDILVLRLSKWFEEQKNLPVGIRIVKKIKKKVQRIVSNSIDIL
jgi:hypothetical protein